MDHTKFMMVLAGSMIFGAAIGDIFSVPIFGCILGGIFGCLITRNHEK
jgi:uncharacterized membrane protein